MAGYTGQSIADMIVSAVGCPDEAARLLREAADILSTTGSKRSRDDSGVETGAYGITTAARVGFLGGKTGYYLRVANNYDTSFY